MSRLELIDADSWREFVAAPTAVLMLARNGCPACAAWTEELQEVLSGEETPFAEVRFGKVLLDSPGLADFKRQNPWLAQLEGLPTTVIYRHGERVKTFAGGGWTRLENRLKRIRSD